MICFLRERQTRPSLWLLRQIAPHPNGVRAIAEAFRLPTPPALIRDWADRSMADRIRRQSVLERSATRDATLKGLLQPLVEAAVTACRQADDVFRQAAVAQALVLQAEQSGATACWLAPMRAVVDRLATKGARLLVVAHLRSEQAEGAARAIGLARQGEPWAPASVALGRAASGDDLLADWLAPN